MFRVEEMPADTLTVESLLCLLRDRGVSLYYRPNSGNAGDSLINVGLFDLCQRLGVRITVVDDGFDFAALRACDVLMLGGGGNLVPYWPGTAHFLRRIADRRYPVILLPNSLMDVDDLLKTCLFEKDVLFLRELYSYKYARGLNLRCRVCCDHDTAFHADVAALRKLAGLGGLARRAGRARAADLARLSLISYHRVRSRIRPHLDAWRVDSEARFDAKRLLAHDLSRVTAFGTDSMAANRFSAAWLLRALSYYRTVRTDRLHAMIARVIQGLPVVVEENAYHKIRGVHEYSIAPDPARDRLVRIAGRPA